MRKELKIKNWILPLSIGAGILFAGGLYWFARQSTQAPTIGGDFTLHSTRGPVSLHDFKGRPVVLYFGYTSCPDVCPLSMSKLSRVVAQLPEAVRKNLELVFVSVDYRKDTPEKAQNYVSFFFKGAQAVGLTGSKEEIDRVVSLFKTGYVIEDVPTSALGYSIQHPSDFFLIDKRGKFSALLPTEESNEELKKGLESIL
ncbi:MAG: SCO family protein [Oligoflexia bacterium]|nr:SCO family protein [Oligoflexia bacterium]